METRGEKLVRVDFNVSNDSDVANFKVKVAELIDIMDDLKSREQMKDDESYDLDIIRHCSLAMTALEEGAMWGVKAITS